MKLVKETLALMRSNDPLEAWAGRMTVVLAVIAVVLVCVLLVSLAGHN